MADRAQNQERSRVMLETPVKKLIISMAVPTIIGQLITIIYNLTDMYFVSSLGTNATAAVTTSPVMTTYHE